MTNRYGMTTATFFITTARSGTQWLADALRRSRSDRGDVELTPEMRAELQALGYLGDDVVGGGR